MNLRKMIISGICLGVALSIGNGMNLPAMRNPGTPPLPLNTPRPNYPQNNMGMMNGQASPTGEGQRVYPMVPTPSGLLGPAKKDTYGPGAWSDGTGRPFHWKTQDGQRIPFGRVTPDAYGPGVGMDEYGRPLRAVPNK